MLDLDIDKNKITTKNVQDIYLDFYEIDISNIDVLKF